MFTFMSVLFQNIISKHGIGISNFIFRMALIMFWKRDLHTYACTIRYYLHPHQCSLDKPGVVAEA